ncbi:MAG: hypothetical protein GX267_01090 [Fibrobacter sp.]|jgi:hypothetical protein|nr:hypothetical protein [Fibrobacter sp.]
MNKSLMWMLAAGCVAGSFATDARIVSMGRHDAFFMDEVSIFRNPANISIYPNMVYGSIGYYMPDSTRDNTNTQFSAMGKSNRDPVDPFWGATVSYCVDNGTDGANQYPMISFGAMFNRRDEMMDYFTPGNSKYLGGESDTILQPLGKVDLLLGYVMKNGGMIGIGAYGALNKQEINSRLLKSAIYRGNIGVNWPVAKSMDLELSVGGGTITAYGAEYGNTGHSNTKYADKDYFGRIEGRLFSALPNINGDFVPHIRVDVLELSRNKVTQVDLAAGIGFNLNIDKGFFWSGLEFLYGTKDYNGEQSNESIGAKISFGIEKNIWTDWLVLRTGGQKKVLFIKDGPSNYRMEENASDNGLDDDFLGIGFGLNIDNRLRVDFVVAEDIFYTLTNLVSAPQHHLFNRVSATYSF